MIPDAAVEAAAKWLHDNDCRSALHSGFPADIECYDWLDEAKELLEAAAPHMLAGVSALADAWVARGEHDMTYSKTIPDEDIAIEILTNGAAMVENARHIRNAMKPTP